MFGRAVRRAIRKGHNARKRGNHYKLATSLDQMRKRKLSHINVAEKIDVHNLFKNLKVRRFLELSMRGNTCSKYTDINSCKLPDTEINDLLAVGLDCHLACNIVHIKIAEFAVALAH
jgi:hypothetical protein